MPVIVVKVVGLVLFFCTGILNVRSELSMGVRHNCRGWCDGLTEARTLSCSIAGFLQGSLVSANSMPQFSPKSRKNFVAPCKINEISKLKAKMWRRRAKFSGDFFVRHT